MFKQDKKVELLRGIDLLKACSLSELRTVASLGDHVAVRAGEVLPPLERSFVLVTSGEACVGNDTLKAGDSRGAVALLGGPAEDETFSMRTDGRLLVVGRREFTTLMRRVPGFAAGVAEQLARRFGQTA
jgi:CRP-like cAMP-binding protein